MGRAVEYGDCSVCGARLCRFTRSQTPRRTQRIIGLARGERIAPCEGRCVRFWTVLSGTLAICTTLRDGRRQISTIEPAGGTIGGPMASAESPVWLEALEPTRVCEVDLSNEAGALRSDPDFMGVMFEVVHARLESATRHLTTLGRLDSTERVMLFLAETAARAPAGAPVQLCLSREDMADHLGLNAETVSRVFSKLKRTGMFRFLSPTTYEVVDPEALARLLPVSIRPGRRGSVLPGRPPSQAPTVPAAAARRTCPVNPGTEPRRS